MNRFTIAVALFATLLCVANAAKPSSSPSSSAKVCDTKQGWVVINKSTYEPAILAAINNDASIEGANVATKKECAIVKTTVQKACEKPLVPGPAVNFQYEAMAQMKCAGKKPGQTKTENVKFTRNYSRPGAATPAPIPTPAPAPAA